MFFGILFYFFCFFIFPFFFFSFFFSSFFFLFFSNRSFVAVGQFPERVNFNSGTADPMFLKPTLTEIKRENGGKGEKGDWNAGLRAFGRGENSDKKGDTDKGDETDREKSRREFDSRWKRHRSVTYTEATSMALIAPYIKFIRRNEEVLSRKVAKLSMLLREAKGDTFCYYCCYQCYYHYFYPSFIPS